MKNDRKLKLKKSIFLILSLLPCWLFSQQIADSAFQPVIRNPAYKPGKGPVVVFGEAAMFTAQLAGPQKNKTGMNSTIAPQNFQLLLNIIHWLDRILR